MTTAAGTRDRLLAAATELLRREGYAGTGVGAICREAGVTKGAFFHHFASKEDLVTACLARWDAMGAGLDAAAPYWQVEDPAERVLAYVDFYVSVFGDSAIVKSCLAGTTAQEAAGLPAAVRGAAHACLAHAQERLRDLLARALEIRGRPADAASLAALWMATLQGSLVLGKASGDGAVVGANLLHFRRYLELLLSPEAQPSAGASRRDE